MSAKATQIKDLDRDTKVVFTCIGSYLSEIYFRHLYLKAKEKRQQQKVKTNSEGYRESVRLFLNATKSKKKNEVFAGMIKNIAPLFHAKGKIFTSAEVVDCIAKELIPHDYYADLTNDHKNRIVMKTLFSVIEQFTALIYAEYITDIVDGREDNGDEVEEKITTCIIELLTAARDKYYWKFAETNHRRTDDDADKALFQRVRKEASFLKEECEELRRQLHMREKIIYEMKKAIDMRDTLIRKRAEEKRAVDAELARLRKSMSMRARPALDGGGGYTTGGSLANSNAPSPRTKYTQSTKSIVTPVTRPTRPQAFTPQAYAPQAPAPAARAPKVYRPSDNITLDAIEESMFLDDSDDAKRPADEDILASGDGDAEADADAEDIFAERSDARQNLEDVLQNQEVKDEEEFLDRALAAATKNGGASAPSAPSAPLMPSAPPEEPPSAPLTTDADALKTKPRKPRKKSKKDVVDAAPGIFDNAPDL